MDLMKYGDVVSYLKSKKRVPNLLIGNGFSISYSPSIFSYNALSSFINSSEDLELKTLFSVINTSNFEQIMRELDLFVKILNVFNESSDIIQKLSTLSGKLKKMLIEAVETSHPENVFSIPQNKLNSCADFLNFFTESNGKIFSSNYDLLLYWVLMRSNNKNCIDGFGRDKEDGQEFLPAEEADYSELRWGKHKENQNIFYLHGALHLFDMVNEIVKQEYDGRNNLMKQIENLMDNGVYPIFVTAGNGEEKLNHIKHNYYLAYCYDALCNISGSLITHGFNFGEYDEHIIQAINKAASNPNYSKKLWSIYIGVYNESDEKHIESIMSKFKCKVNLFDSKTANIWGN
ncbi:DUF4917 family protein [Treponema pectinovorum]|uniref:DUF4917 family protein n=1 Tax=Treponema pectinovorum TaxID=164 RepID=UPI00164DF82A|nr:DUF4917 family protein [Treponema pectinovorum]